MPHEIGFVDDSVVLAHYAMLEKINTFAVASGWWTVMRYDDSIPNRELILKGEGFSGAEEIYVGFRCYQDAGADYYNLTAACFTGYVAENSFATQPGAILCGVPAHNQRIDYWLTVNPQRIALALKVGLPVYESAYVGKFLPYAKPNQYPLPIVCAGMLNGEAATRFSESSHTMGYRGSSAAFRMRFNDGVWQQPQTWPWNNNYVASSSATSTNGQLRDTESDYPFPAVVLMDSTNVYGELDGIRYCSGFNNVVENTTTMDGDDYVIIQDVARNGFVDFYAMRLDPNA